MLSDVVDIVILVAAFLMALLNIYNFFAKPTSFLKRKQQENLKDKIKEVLDETMPGYLEEHDLKTRNKYLADRQKYLQEIETEVLSHTEKDLREIKSMNENQSKIIDLLRKNTLDVLRQKIEKIYYDYRVEKKMPRYIKESLDELYKDYTEGGGNHHIGKLYTRMCEWEVYDAIPEYDKDI